MKAIQIRYIPATDTKPVRLKAWAEGVKPLIVSRSYDDEPSIQARQLARQYIQQCGWGNDYNGFGSLPNGDYVATLGE